MLKNYVLEIVEDAIKKTDANVDLSQFKLVAEKPKNQEFGDFSVNVTSLAKVFRKAPAQIAQDIISNITPKNFEINAIQGFINFKFDLSFLLNQVVEILDKKEDYAKNNQGQGLKVNLEYVSANPTGPFHIGHGRWAAMGSALANLLKYSGYNVYQEFDINDAGSQIKKLGRSFYIRVLQASGFDVDFPQNEEEQKNYYTGEFLIPAAKEYVEQNGKLNENKELTAEELKVFSDWARFKMLALQQELLENFNVHFDNFYSELDLHKSGKVDMCFNMLKEKGELFEQDGAIWFRTTKYGDDQDRVLKKSDGTNTYLTADIAYHYDKFQRGFDKLINIWGADHHGYIPRMRAAIDALGYNSDNLEVLLGQLVNLVINNEQVRMGKRTKMITLDDLINDVGVDATRYWMIFRSIDTTLDFDIDLAKSKTDENPVFYVQYAHARACSILRNAVCENKDIETGKIKSPYILQQELDEIFTNPNISLMDIIANDNDEKIHQAQKALVLKLEEFKYLIYTSAQNRAPYMICKYLTELAQCFHSFYAACRVMADNKELGKARLALTKAVQIILKTGLNLIGVSAPEKM